jgi:hypothetical protein
MVTLGIWIGPSMGAIVAVVAAAIGSKFGWFRPRLRRRVALQRIAASLAKHLADGDSFGSTPHLYDRYREHFLGGREFNEEWDKANVYDAERGIRDERGPALTRWQLLFRRLLRIG